MIMFAYYLPTNLSGKLLSAITGVKSYGGDRNNNTILRNHCFVHCLALRNNSPQFYALSNEIMKCKRLQKLNLLSNRSVVS